MLFPRINSILLSICLIFSLVLRIVVSDDIYSGDVNNHTSWGADILDNGAVGIYERDFMPTYGTLTPTYPPFSLAIFAASELAYRTIYYASTNLNKEISIFPSKLIWHLEDQDVYTSFFKVWAILSDLIIMIFSYYFLIKNGIKKSTASLLVLIFIGINPAFWYNSAYWGQIESIPIMFIFLAVYSLFFRNDLSKGILFIASALLIKQSSIVFVPFLILAVLKRFPLHKVLISCLLTAIISFLSFAPFFNPSNKTTNLVLFPINTYINKIATGSGSDYVTDHAFNFWAIYQGDLKKVNDSNLFIGNMSFKFSSVIIYVTLTIFVFIAYFRTNHNPYTIMWYMGITISLAYIFLTRMHERYLFPSIPFLMVSARKKISYVFIAILSLLHFITLYHNWWAPRFQNTVLLLDNNSAIMAISVGIIGSVVGVIISNLMKKW